jgi:hypothetical protein
VGTSSISVSSLRMLSSYIVETFFAFPRRIGLDYYIILGDIDNRRAAGEGFSAWDALLNWAYEKGMFLWLWGVYNNKAHQRS